MSKASAVLQICLNETVAGYLTRFPDNRHLFLFDQGYRLSGPDRPALSLSFMEPGDEATTERKLGRTIFSAIRLPEFFSNLLPEGALREYLARRLKIHTSDEFSLLAALGENLPGAVRAIPSERVPDSVRSHPLSAGKQHAPAEPAYFSLGGAQMKFSMIEHGGRFTLSTHGVEWIVKPPHPTFPQVPENEYSMMNLAAAAGVELPEVKLVRMEQVDLSALPGTSYPPDTFAYAIRRYDRETYGRVHAEDFAQVFGVYPEREYDATNYDTIGRLLFNVLPSRHEALEEFIRRLVVHILIGNADAHLKNWSVIYPDGRTPRLSPAYDLISTIQYTPDTRLALNLAGEKRFGAIGITHFRSLAQRIGAEEAFVIDAALKTSKSARGAWRDLLPSLPLPESMRQKLIEHWKNCPVFNF
jgi:serine/threonine-protein kinase HipA